jgi:hypothetical protein
LAFTPTMEAMLTIRPYRRRAIEAKARRVRLTAPERFVSSTFRQSSSVNPVHMLSARMPALFTSTSTAPSFASALSNSCSTPSGSDTSPATVSAHPPPARTSATTRSAPRRSRQ